MAGKRIIVLMLVFATLGSACDIELDIEKGSYDGGDTVKIVVEVDPSDGFVELKIENPYDKYIYEATREIDDTLTFELDTEDTWVNGTYTVIAEYIEYYGNSSNLTDCGRSQTTKFELETDHSPEDTALVVAIDATHKQTSLDKVGRIEKDGVTYNVQYSATGVEGYMPDFSISEVSVIDNVGAGNINLVIERCVSDDEFLANMDRLAAFYDEQYNGSEFAKEMLYKCQQSHSTLQGNWSQIDRKLYECEYALGGRVGWDGVFLAFILGAAFLRGFQWMWKRQSKGTVNLPKFKEKEVKVE